MYQRSYLSRGWFFTFILFLGLGIIGLITLQLKQSFLDNIRLSESRSFQKATFLIEEKVNSYIHGLQGMSGIHLVNNGTISPRLVRDYAVYRHFFTNFPGALGFGFVRRVEKKSLDTYLANKRKDFKTFNIRSITQKTYPDHFIIEVIEPIETNAVALGLDVGSEIKRREAAELSMRTGKPALTAPIDLVQNKKAGKGFLFFLPLYNKTQTPETINEREKSIIGWSYTPIQSSGLIDFLRNSVDEQLVLQLYDSSGELIIKNDQAVDKRYRDNWFETTISVGGRQWLIKGAVLKSFNVSMINLATILFFLFFGFVYTWFIYRFRKVVKKSEESEIKNQQMESWQSAILNGADYAIISTLPNGIITTFNKAAERMTGYQATELIGEFSPAIFHDLDEVKQKLRYLSHEHNIELTDLFDAFIFNPTKDGTETQEWTYINKNGSRIPVKLCVTPLKDASDEIIGYLGVAEDISQIKKMEATIETQRLAMISGAKMSALGEMAAGVAHEINNPLAIISGRLTVMRMMLEDNKLEKENIEEGLSKINETCFRISKIVKGLRAFSRDSGTDPMEETTVGKILEDTLELCRERLKNHLIDLTVEGDLSATLNCRSVEISQVLMNLISNSMDAIDHLTVKWINIKVISLNNKLMITVTDSGNGIPQEVAEKMMDPFFTTKQLGKGTGLGLSISKGIIEAHGGRLSYKISEGHTQFVIEF